MSDAIIRIDIERLPEGVWLATSEDLPGLVVQGRTIAEALEFAQDAAQKLVELHLEHGDPLPPALSQPVPQRFTTLIAVDVP